LICGDFPEIQKMIEMKNTKEARAHADRATQSHFLSPFIRIYAKLNRKTTKIAKKILSDLSRSI